MKPYRLFADGPEPGQLVELYDADEDAELGSALPEPRINSPEASASPTTNQQGDPK
jgi:hypothetical protein